MIAVVMSIAIALIVVWVLALVMCWLDRRLGDIDRDNNVLTEVPFVQGQIRVDLWIARRFKPLVLPLLGLIAILAVLRGVL